MIQAKRAKCKHKITQRTTNSIFLHKYFWKSPFVELLNRLSVNTWMWKRTNTAQGKRTYWTQSEIKQNITKKTTRKQLWQIWMCVWNLLFSPRRISREYKQKKRVNNKKQQLNNKNKSREKKYIFESKELINVNKIRRRSARQCCQLAPPRGEHNKRKKHWQNKSVQ